MEITLLIARFLNLNVLIFFFRLTEFDVLKKNVLENGSRNVSIGNRSIKSIVEHYRSVIDGLNYNLSNETSQLALKKVNYNLIAQFYGIK